MSKTNVEQLILRMESYLECWKQFNTFMAMARAKKFGQEDENQFLEIKSVITQELELILSALEIQTPTKDEIHTLIAQAPSLRYVSEMNEGAIRGMENQWHKIFIAWQALVGQLKVQQKADDKKGFFQTLFGKKD